MVMHGFCITVRCLGVYEAELFGGGAVNWSLAAPGAVSKLQSTMPAGSNPRLQIAQGWFSATRRGNRTAILIGQYPLVAANDEVAV
jgi:hypothetical protein